jgi:hypothetical protein
LAPDVFSNIVNESFNFIGNNSGSNIVAGDPNGNHSKVGTSLFPLDPRLGPLASHGGPTKTRALLKGSGAINSGSNPLNVPYDQRGVGFFRVVGKATDIGAFEVQKCKKKDRSCNHNEPDDDGDYVVLDVRPAFRLPMSPLSLASLPRWMVEQAKKLEI